MKIKVNGEEVSNLVKKSDNYTLDLYGEIKGCIDSIEHLKENYISAESPYITQICESYFENLKVLPFTLNEINKATKKANSIYDEQDNSFLKELQKEEIEASKDGKDIY